MRTAAGRRYQILARIGGGGMGVVYLGRSPGGRSVAVKRVHPELAEDQEFRDRFRREVEVARRVGGGFSVPVIDAEPDADIPWLVTEFVPSISVAEAVRTAGALPVATVRVLAAGVAEALRSIHDAGVVHRDVKPSNVLLTADGPRVIDFGIARAVDAATVTRPGGQVGSPAFMSPEQVAGDAVGPPGDIFSYGATLAYACTGVEPFGQGPWQVVMYRIQSEPPRLDGVPDAELRTLIEACMARAREDRPTTAELVERTRRLVGGDVAFGGAAEGDAAGGGISGGDAAGGTPGGRLGGSWLPPAVVEEIDRREREAENPPLPPGPPPASVSPQRPTFGPAVAESPASPGAPRRGGRARRYVMGGAAAAVCAVTLALVTWHVVGRDPATAVDAGTASRTAGGAPGPSAPRPSAVTPSPTAKPRTLEINITGNTKLTSLTYTVNGERTKLTNVTLPWRTVVEVPPRPQRARWRMSFRFRPGKINWRVLVDGFEVATGVNAAAGAPGSDTVKGTG